jgi:hypothetical protein
VKYVLQEKSHETHSTAYHTELTRLQRLPEQMATLPMIMCQSSRVLTAKCLMVSLPQWLLMHSIVHRPVTDLRCEPQQTFERLCPLGFHGHAKDEPSIQQSHSLCYDRDLGSWR